MQFDAQPRAILQDVLQRLETRSEPSVVPTTHHETTRPTENLPLAEPANDTAKAGMQFDVQPRGIVSQHDPMLYEESDGEGSLVDFSSQGNFVGSGNFINHQDITHNGGFTDNGYYTGYGPPGYGEFNNGDSDNHFWDPNHPQ